MSDFYKSDNFSNLQYFSILYVEDNSDTRTDVFSILIDRVAIIYTAENGRVGLDLFIKQKPDIVITGIQMPVMNGIEMIREIKKINSEIPIIILTEESDEKYFLQAIDLGVEKYIKKPVENKQLILALSQIASDIFQKKEIKSKNEIIHTILDSHPDLMLICQGRNIHYMNKSFQNMLGKSFTFSSGDQLSMIDRFLVFPENSYFKNISFYEIIQEISGKENGNNIVYLRNEAEKVINTYLINTKYIQGFPEILVSLTDITQIDREKQFFHELAMKDPLTGAFNRNRFDEDLRQEIERSHRYNHRLSLVTLDIDFFKRFNDQYGHPVGDKILIYLTRLITENIRAADIFARYGGEEFMILLPETDIEKAGLIAENLRKLIETDSEDCEDFPDKITCSFGVSELLENDGPESIIERVDEALYIAKNSGRNCVMLK